MNFDILFIDDNSIDGSQEIIKKLAKKSKKVRYIFRPKKMGIGSAHKDAFKWAYKKKYQILISIDADGTHDPKYLKLFVNKLKDNDIVISNRFMKSSLLKDWPMLRIWLTYLRHSVIRFLLSIPYDSSGAFRCIDCKKVSLSDLILAKDNGYSYFWESIFILHQKKYKIAEKHFKKAIDIIKDYSKAHFHLAMLLKETGPIMSKNSRRSPREIKEKTTIPITVTTHKLTICIL